MASDIAACKFDTALDAFTGQEVHVAPHLRDRKVQRVLLQFFKPDNDFEVRNALLEAGRHNVIGSGCDALMAAEPPREALEGRRKQATQAARGDSVHEIPNPGRPAGYRPAGSRHAAGRGRE
jgi:Domain of unknown function (DUF3362)